MAASTVNISDFRCRGANVGPCHQAMRPARASAGFVVAEPEREAAHREAELPQQALISENPSVFDIGIARRAERARHRVVFRPITIQRHRANVIRFGEPGVTVMRPKGSNGHLYCTSTSHDHDLPPAA